MRSGPLLVNNDLRMNLWLAGAVALVCALTGVALGWWFSRQRSPYWILGYLVPMLLVLAYALAIHLPALMFMRPFCWMMLGIKKFVTLGFVATLVLTTPLSRVPKVRDRAMIAGLMAVIVFFVSIRPFVAPMLARGELSHLQTKIDNNGVCRQSTGYTCGPAAAVTALRKLRLPAEEGQIGILSCTSNQEGTPIDMLAAGLEREYGKEGLVVKCRVFKDILELREAGLTLAVIKYSLLADHWVTVLEVTDAEVIVGDPLAGRTRLSYDQFCRRWRFIGIVLERELPLGGD